MGCDRLEQITSIISTLCGVLSFILEIVENSATELAKYYIYFEAMTAALLEKVCFLVLPFFISFECKYQLFELNDRVIFDKWFGARIEIKARPI